MKSNRIILDTNLLISFLITNRFNELDELLINRRIKFIFSDESIAEFITVAKRPKFQKYFNDSKILRLLKVFDEFGELIKVNIHITKCRDKKDDFLLSLAVESDADFLITGDKDLLTLKKIEKTYIITWRKFLNIMHIS